MIARFIHRIQKEMLIVCHLVGEYTQPNIKQFIAVTQLLHQRSKQKLTA